MNETSTFVPDDPDDEILAEFVLEIEQIGPDNVDADAWCAKHPTLKKRLRDTLRMHKALEVSRPEEDTAPPERLGEFRIVRRIARGGMGDIYEAIQDRLERRVAVKTIRQGRLSLGLQQRFLREQKILGRFHHTHIVSVHMSGEEGPLQYFAMPYIEGASVNNVVELLSDLRSSRSDSQTPSLGALARIATSDTVDGEDETLTHVGSVSLNQLGAASSEGRAVRRSLSQDYLRSVAKVMADVADAVQHAHDQKPPILHRDIKPSNIMVDTSEQCWIIDFGLGGYVSDTEEPESSEDTEHETEPDRSTTGAVGTPQYMAPEQFVGEADERTDVWGLGATLYELLTLRRAFPGESVQAVRQAVAETSPARARQIVPGLPRDLDAICHKALEKPPKNRYPSAGEFADDLRRWLRGEVTMAMPVRTFHRVQKWSRRNRGWATAIIVALTSCIIIATGAFEIQRTRSTALQTVAEETSRVRLAGLRGTQFRAGIKELQRTRTVDRIAGWSGATWDIARGARNLLPEDGPSASADLRNETAATLSGLDATLSKRFDFSASSLAFSSEDQELAFGANGRGEARIWHGSIWDPFPSGNSAEGPVAFTREEVPVQFVRKDRTTLELWDMQARQSIRAFAIPEVSDKELAGTASQESAVFAVSADASVVAALTQAAEGRTEIVVWDADSAELLQQLPFEISSLLGSLEGTLALSPDGKLVAAGNQEGNVSVWSVETGMQLTRFDAGRNTVRCLAFGANLRRRRVGMNESQLTPWLLAAGDAAGAVTIWDLGRISVRSICLGSHYDVYSIAFSPDGVLLASGGRSRPRIWDTATGMQILELDNADVCGAIAFSNLGSRLAVAAQRPPKTEVWALESGRGIRTLRGLTSQVSKVVPSPDGTMLAAISHGWELGIWEMATGRLLHVLESPRGLFADNVAFAFSPDGEQLAIAAGGLADLWDLTEGKRQKTWELPPGLVDIMAFHPDGALLLFRVECEDGVTPPFSNAHPAEHPRVCRVRDLLSGDPPELLKEINDFPWRVLDAAVAPDATYFVVNGLQDGSDGSGSIQTFEALTGEALWSMETRVKMPQEWRMRLGSGGTLSAVEPGSPHSALLLDMPTGTALGTLHPAPSALTKGAQIFVTVGPKQSTGRPHGYSIFRKGTLDPFVTLGIDTPIQTDFPNLSPDGERLIWGTTDGTVLVCDLPEIQRRLAELRLGW